MSRGEGRLRRSLTISASHGSAGNSAARGTVGALGLGGRRLSIRARLPATTGVPQIAMSRCVDHLYAHATMGLGALIVCRRGLGLSH